MKEEAHRLEVAAQEMETKGLEKVEVVVAGSEVEGLYGLLRGDVTPLHIFSPTSPKKGCHILSTTVSHQPPQESTGPKVSSLTVGIGSCFSSCPSSFRGNSPHWYAAPLHSVGGIKWVYWCQVDGCKEGPSTSHATICAHVCKVHLGMGLVCPSCGKSFFKLDTFWWHKKGHVNL